MRRSGRRMRTIGTREFSSVARRETNAQQYAADVAALGYEPLRPTNYRECRLRGLGTTEPCPWVGCGYHLAIDHGAYSGKGRGIRWTFPDREFAGLRQSCALAVAEHHADGLSLDEVGALLNLTRESVRKIETTALAKLKSLSDLAALQDHAE